MAFEPVFEVVKINSKRRLAKTQAVVEAKLLPAPNTVIARVLSITADSVIGASEVFTGEIRCCSWMWTGIITAWITMPTSPISWRTLPLRRI